MHFITNCLREKQVKEIRLTNENLHTEGREIYANCKLWLSLLFTINNKQAKKSMQIANKNANLRRDGGEIYEISPKKSKPVKGRSTQIANLDSVPKVLPLSTTANCCCWPTAQIMPRLCTNHAKIMHKSGVSTMCPICTLTDENESMQSLSITVISFSLSINKGDVPRVYVAQAVFWKAKTMLEYFQIILRLAKTMLEYFQIFLRLAKINAWIYFEMFEKAKNNSQSLEYNTWEKYFLISKNLPGNVELLEYQCFSINDPCIFFFFFFLFFIYSQFWK